MPRSVRATTAAVLLALSGTLTATLVVVPSAAASSTVSSRTLLSQLTEAPETPAAYSASQFPMWTAAPVCNTRGEVLWTEAVKRPTVTGCNKLGGTMTGGTWKSPYDGLVVHDATKLTIDHVVPLAEAWFSGASSWDRDTRTRYANDLAYAPSLIAVSKASAAAKGPDDPGTWLPSVASYRCTYLKYWVAVKWRWHLSVDYDEESLLSSKLAACGWPSVVTPTLASVTVVPTATSTPTAPTSPGTPTTAPPASGATVDLNGIIEIPYDVDVLTGSLPRCAGIGSFSNIQVGITVTALSGSHVVGTGSVTGCQWVDDGITYTNGAEHDYWSPDMSLRVPGVPDVTGLVLHIDGSPAVSLGAQLPDAALVLRGCDGQSNLLCVS